ncbi:hypothetical protein [Nocardioides convexus]|uniref:hypothetical protein n=1 Tax=Nocardioides convexus TaxID=2712224 RepID=UPI0024181D62|nr:hypothetical protein [Nocardioides convexus]
MTISGKSFILSAVAAVTTVVATALPASAVTQAAAESAFRAAGITWTSSGGCTNRNVSTCTSFDGLRQASVDGAVTLKRASGCGLTITGGTETGHASGTYSHWNGYKPGLLAHVLPDQTGCTTPTRTRACAATAPLSTRPPPATCTPTRATTGT